MVYELETSRQTLARRLEKPIVSFAWPSGWYDDGLIEMAARAGYSNLATTDEGVNPADGSALAIRRYPVYGQFGLDEFEQLLAGEIDDAEYLLPEGASTDPRPPYR